MFQSYLTLPEDSYLHVLKVTLQAVYNPYQNNEPTAVELTS